MKTYRPNDSDELRRDLQNASPNDTLILKPGTYYLDRIYRFNNLTIQGGDDDATKTIIRPMQGRAFRCAGGSTFKNFSSQGGGNVIEAEGHGTTIQNFISWNGNIPVKLAGDDHLFDGGLIYEAGRTGVEINGGFYLIPELSDKPFRLKKEVGLLGEKSQQWNTEQQKRFDDLFYHRNMNTVIRNVTGVRCGFRGGMMYGAFIKAVPNAGGITLRNNVGIENINDYWNDFASDEKFYIHDNLSVRTYANSIFVEGYVGDTARVDIYNNIVLGTDRALFVSAFPEARSWGNRFAFNNFGKVVHGLTGNREGRNVSCITPNEDEADKLISLTSDYYQAHHLAAIEANYNFSKDDLYQSEQLDLGPLRSESPGNNYGPFEEIQNVPIWHEVSLTPADYEYMIDERYRLPKVLSVLNQVPFETPKDDLVIVPPPPISDNKPVWIFSDYSLEATDGEYVNDADDAGALAAALICNREGYEIQGITVGCYPNKKDPAKLYDFPDPHTQFRKNHIEELGKWKYNEDYTKIPFGYYLAETYEKKFKNLQGKIDTSFLGLENYSELYLINFGILTEIAAIIDALSDEDRMKIKIISHYTFKDTDNNHRKDKEAYQFIQASGVPFLEVDKAGAQYIDDKTFPKMADFVLTKPLGKYFGDKWQSGKPDFSDFAALMPFIKKLGFGPDWLAAAKWDGSSNLPHFGNAFTGKQSLYDLIESKLKGDDSNGGNGGNTPVLQKIKEALDRIILEAGTAKRLIE